MLDPRRLLTFREVARQGSFSKAAEALALTQPAVSQQVGSLERELGATLLTRGRGGAVVTPAGELLLEHAEALAARLELADSQMEEMADKSRLSLRFGSFPSALATIVPVAIEALRRAHPKLEVAIEEAPTSDLADEVAAGRLHAAVAFQDADMPRREVPGLRRVDIAEEPFVAVFPTGHRLAKRKRVALEDMADEPWMAPSAGGRFLLRIEDLDRARSKPEHERTQIADLRAIGLDWDEEPVHQSERTELYREALERLQADGRVYPCWCTRAEIRAAAEAPHGPLPEGAYPGTCRKLTAAERAERERSGRPAALRLDARAAEITFQDLLHDETTGVVDDFVLW